MIREGLDAVVCDLDGVVYRGENPITGSSEALARLNDLSIRVLYSTNNSRSTVAQYVDKLAAVGVSATSDQIVTSAIVTAETLEKRGYSGKTAIVVGGDGIRQALGDVCISVKDDPEVTKADLVVVGWDPSFTYTAMARASRAVINGALLIATNSDASFPAADGLLPGAGAILASIETASKGRAEVMGKPHPPMLRTVAARLEGCTRIAVVGDRADTDLAGARAMGWTSVLVTSGVTSPEQSGSIEPAPDLVFDDLAAFVDSL